MNGQEYYQRVIDRMSHCYQYSHYVIAAGNELVREGADPAFPAVVAPVSQLGELTLRRGLQVHLPIIGAQSQAVLMPLDFEIYLGADHDMLYADRRTHRKIFGETLPVAGFLESLFRSRGMPYLLDYTPSGGHFLFYNLMEKGATQELKRIGFLEEDLVRACQYRDPHDIRRWDGISLDAALVFSALGKLAEYIALLTMDAFRENEAQGHLPVTISDSLEHCINMDNSWSEGSPFMRAIRCPFSLHKKNQEKHGKHDQPPLVDVIGTYFDGQRIVTEPDPDVIQACMWDLQKAAEHSERFTGYIPSSNDSLVEFLREYQASDLCLFHEDFESQGDLPRGAAVERARRERNVPEWAREIVRHPNPSALQPKKMIGFVHDFLVGAGWHPRHIANILRDLYIDPQHGWTQDFFRYPAEEKADFWARTYGAVNLWRLGKLRV